MARLANTGTAEGWQAALITIGLVLDCRDPEVLGDFRAPALRPLSASVRPASWHELLKQRGLLPVGSSTATSGKASRDAASLPRGPRQAADPSAQSMASRVGVRAGPVRASCWSDAALTRDARGVVRTADPPERVVSSEPAGTLLSVNIGLPKEVSWQGRTVVTGVFKDSVPGSRRVGRLNVEGDGQGDLAGHGGEQRAVFVYQIDSYHYWERELSRDDFVYGQFGENFTVEGLGDDKVCIGDRYQIGSATFEVTQPRVTCYRVGIRMNDPRMPALLVSHHRPGFYFRVLEEGEVQAGDEIIKVMSGPEQMTVSEVDALLYLPGHTRQGLLRALRVPALSPGWQGSFRALLERRTWRRQCWPGGNQSASRLARLPSGDRQSRHPRERLRRVDAPRGPRWRSTPRGSRRSIHHGASPARPAATGAVAQLFALRATRGGLLPNHRQAGTGWRGKRLSRYSCLGGRPTRRGRTTRRVHPRPERGAGAADQRRDRGDPGSGHAAGAGAGALQAGDLVALWRTQRS